MHRGVAVALCFALVLAQPPSAAANTDWLGKAVDTVSEYFSQNPNTAEMFSSAKDNAENIQHAQTRRMQYREDTWLGCAAEFYNRGKTQVQKYSQYLPIIYAMNWAKTLLPRQITDIISSLLDKTADSASTAGNAALFAADSVGGLAAKAAGVGVPSGTFGDIHTKAQEGAERLAEAAQAANQKLREAADVARNEL